MRMRRGALAALALAAAVLSGGCAGSLQPVGSAPAHPAGSSPAAAPDVLVEVLQLRGDVATGHVELRVTNESDALLTVVRATYASSRWAEPMVRENEAEIAPGQRRNLRLLLPEPTCDRAPIAHLATLELADGTLLEHVPQDPLGQLGRLDGATCDLRLFEQRVAALTWLEPTIPADGSGTAELRLQVAPAAGPDAQDGGLESIGATTLLAPVDASGQRREPLPLAVPIEAGGAPSVLEVPLEPGRCDLHAIAEDKQGTVFRVQARIAGEPTELVLVSPEAQREALLDWAVERCAAQP